MINIDFFFLLSDLYSAKENQFILKNFEPPKKHGMFHTDEFNIVNCNSLLYYSFK